MRLEIAALTTLPEVRPGDDLALLIHQAASSEGEILDRSAALVRAGGTLVTITRVPTVQPKDGHAIFFVVEPDRSQLAELAQRLRDGRLKPIVGAVRPLAEAPAAFAPDRRSPGKTIIQIAKGG